MNPLPGETVPAHHPAVVAVRLTKGRPKHRFMPGDRVATTYSPGAYGRVFEVMEVEADSSSASGVMCLVYPPLPAKLPGNRAQIWVDSLWLFPVTDLDD